jgi:hypothetical protein
MGPVGDDTMVQTLALCDADGAKPDGSTCYGWATDGGIEQRCTNPIHHERLVPINPAVVAAGVSYRRYDWWVRAGYIRVPEVHPGSGFPRQITEHEVAVLRLMGVLVGTGVTPALAARLARDLWEDGQARLTDSLVIRYEAEEVAQ